MVFVEAVVFGDGVGDVLWCVVKSVVRGSGGGCGACWWR